MSSTYYIITNEEADSAYYDKTFTEPILAKTFSIKGFKKYYNSDIFCFMKAKNVPKSLCDGIWIREVDIPFDYVESKMKHIVFQFKMTFDTHNEIYTSNILSIGKRYALSDPKTFEMLEEKGAEFDSIKTIQWAIKHNFIEIIKYFFEKNPDKIKENYLDCLISDAFKLGNLDVVKYLDFHLEEVKHFKQKTYNDNILKTPCKNLDIKLFDYLHKKFQMKLESYHVAAFAVKTKRWMLIKAMVDDGFDIHMGDDYLFRQAAKQGNLEMVKLLINKGAQIGSQNYYALRWACREGKLYVVKYLVEKGVNVLLVNDYELKLAIKKGNLHMVEFLVENGIKLDATCIYQIKRAAQKGDLPMVKFLIENGLKPTSLDEIQKWNINKKHSLVIQELLSSLLRKL